MRVKRLNVRQLKKQIRKSTFEVIFLFLIWVFCFGIALYSLYEISIKSGMLLFFLSMYYFVAFCSSILLQKLDQLKVEVIEYDNARNKAR